MLLGALLLASAPAWGDFKSAYMDGVEAADKGDWNQVQAKMREAMADNATPQAKVKMYGQLFRDYVPQYYLGLAAYRTGDCRGAVANWEHAPTRSILSGNSALKGVADAGLSDCRARLAVVTPSPSPTPTATARPSPTPTALPSPTPTATARPSPTPTATARPSPTPTAQPSPTPTAAPSPAPRALAEAVDAFLAGRYELVSNLNTDQFTEPRARWHALILRAASRYTRGALQGEAGAPLVAQAQADIRAAKAVLSPQSPDPQLYSPRFRQLFASTR